MRPEQNTGVTPSMEDYLEAIYWVSRKTPVARSRDIAQTMQVTKSSVTTALRQLSSEGLINYSPYSYVTLTDSGMAIATIVVRRHAILRDFLLRLLGLPEEASDRLACAIEHSIDDTVSDRLEAFMAFADANKELFDNWYERTRV